MCAVETRPSDPQGPFRDGTSVSDPAVAHARGLLGEIERHINGTRDGYTDPRDAINTIALLLASVDGPVNDKAAVNETSKPQSPEASEARVLKNIITTIPYFVFWKDLNLNYLGCNDAFAHAAGLSTAEEIVGMSDRDLPWTAGETEWFQTYDRRVINSGKAELHIEEPQLQADGRRRFVSTSKVPLRDHNNEVVGVLGIFADITLRKEMELQLREAKEAAEASALAKTDFLAAMSHELRTPLTLIISPIESLLTERQHELSPPVVEGLDRVHRNAHRLMILTEDILEFSKHEAGHLRLNVRPLDVGEHVRQLALDLQPTATVRGLELTAQVDHPPGLVMLDIAKFDKILINLISNALKFTPSGGAVKVSVDLREDAILVTVTDNGIGIDPAHHQRLFRRFEQIEGGSTRRYGGTGIGLSLVKVFTELMNGSVAVESELGKGASFTVQIPRRLAGANPELVDLEEIDIARRMFALEAADGEIAAAAAASAGPDAPRVVVVEDNGDLRRYLTDLLSSEFRVTALGDGQAAFEAIRRDQPDVVVSDVMMPVMDGFELLDKMKSDPELATIPVLLLTARSGADKTASGLDRGADDYLSKPFSPRDLLARVRSAYRMRILNRRLLQAELRASGLEKSEALEKARAQLAHLSRVAMLGTLTASIAHEVNQPLAAIVTNGETGLRLLNRGECDLRELRDVTTSIVADARRAATIISRIREIASRRAPEPVAVVVGRVISDVLFFLHQEIKSAGVEFTLDLAQDMPTTMADPINLQQIITNLVVNAMHAIVSAGSRRREVLIRSEIYGHRELLIHIEDSGPGIVGDLDRIFDSFYSTKQNGMGLGLAICRSLVEEHGGQIQADNLSAFGGARLTLRLPLSRSKGSVSE